jgi:hypothetical protein
MKPAESEALPSKASSPADPYTLASAVERLRQHRADRVNDSAFWVCAALLIVMTALHVAVARGIFADGAYFLFEMLTRKGFWHYDNARAFAQFVYQGPVVAAVGAGATSTKFLARLYTLSVELPVVALYLFALSKTRSNAVLLGSFILIVAVVHLNLNFMAMGEYNLSYALATAALAILLQERDLRGFDSGLLLAIAILSSRVYEAQVFLGPMLFIACMVRLALLKPRRIPALAVLFAAFFFAFGSAIAYWSILFPRDPSNFSGAATFSLLLRNHQLILSCVLVAAFAGYLMFTSRAWRILMVMIFAAALVGLALPTTWSPPKFHYYSRTGGGIILFGIGLLLIWFRFSPYWTPRTLPGSLRWPALIVLGPLASVVALSIPDIDHTLSWRRFRHAVQAEVNAKTGLVPPAQTNILPEDLEMFAFSWTFPSMSLLLRGQATSAIVLNEDPRAWQPFDPAKTVPDMQQFFWRDR